MFVRNTKLLRVQNNVFTYKQCLYVQTSNCTYKQLCARTTICCMYKVSFVRTTHLLYIQKVMQWFVRTTCYATVCTYKLLCNFNLQFLLYVHTCFVRLYRIHTLLLSEEPEGLCEELHGAVRRRPAQLRK